MAPSFWRMPAGGRVTGGRRTGVGGRAAVGRGVGRGSGRRSKPARLPTCWFWSLAAVPGVVKPLLELVVLAHQLLIARLQPGHRWKCRWLLGTAAAGPLAGPPRLEEPEVRHGHARNCAQESVALRVAFRRSCWLLIATRARRSVCDAESVAGASACCHPDARSVLVARGSSVGHVQRRRAGGAKTQKTGRKRTTKLIVWWTDTQLPVTPSR